MSSEFVEVLPCSLCGEYGSPMPVAISYSGQYVYAEMPTTTYESSYDFYVSDSYGSNMGVMTTQASPWETVSAGDGPLFAISGQTLFGSLNYSDSLQIYEPPVNSYYVDAICSSSGQYVLSLLADPNTETMATYLSNHSGNSPVQQVIDCDYIQSIALAGFGQNMVAFGPKYYSYQSEANDPFALYVSFDYGGSWANIVDKFPENMNCLYFAIANVDNIYASSCQVRKSSGAYTNTQQVFVSNDMGENWAACNLPLTDYNAIAVSSYDSNVVGVSSSTGIYMSYNSGESWSNVESTSDWERIDLDSNGDNVVAFKTTEQNAGVYVSIGSSRRQLASSAAVVGKVLNVKKSHQA